MKSDLVEPATQLPPGHPGEGDATYIARRSEFTRLVGSLHPRSPLPYVQYTDDETKVWSAVMDSLAPFHEKHATATYLEGFRKLGMTHDAPPEPGPLSEELRRETGFGIVLTDGLLDPRVFLTHLGTHMQPCTVYLRHGSRPDYTPEPDLVHEAVGHAPMLTDRAAASLNALIGRAASTASAKQLEALLHLYWFTLEFGLVEERGEVKAYGAGLLSSFGELPHAFSAAVERRPFDLRGAIEQTYHHDRMQDVLYIAPSLGAVQKDVEAWLGSEDYARMA